MSPPIEIGRAGGCKAAIRELGKVDKALYWASVNELKAAARPLAEAIAAGVPASPPLSGMQGKGRLRWPRTVRAQVRYGGKRVGVEIPLVRVVVTSPAVVMADMAGKRSSGQSAQGRAMIAALNARYNRPSRWIYPAALPYRDEAVRAVLRAANLVMDRTTRNLARNPAPPTSGRLAA